MSLFVLGSSYEYEQARRFRAEHALQKLTKQWNNLVDEINAKGGEEFLTQKPCQFSKAELNVLLRLCHPDKHNGKKSAVELTAKIIKLRTN